MTDDSKSQTTKLPPPPAPNSEPANPAGAPPAPAGAPPSAAPSSPTGAPPAAVPPAPAVGVPPSPTSAPSSPNDASQPTVPPPAKTSPAPPVGPPRFPIPGRLRRSTPKDQKPKSAEEAAKEAEQKEEDSAELIAQRDRLLEKFTVMQADLGGAFYEMAIRDHVRLDVLTRKAAELQRVDAELLAVERVLEMERADAAGLCPGCGAPYGHAVRFCAQCGTPLVPTEAGA